MGPKVNVLAPNSYRQRAGLKPERSIAAHKLNLDTLMR
jgi:hypothetical protein